MLAAVQTVQTKVQTKCTFVYTRKIIDYQHFKTKSAECRQNSKNYVEEVWRRDQSAEYLYARTPQFATQKKCAAYVLNNT